MVMLDKNTSETCMLSVIRHGTFTYSKMRGEAKTS